MILKSISILLALSVLAAAVSSAYKNFYSSRKAMKAMQGETAVEEAVVGFIGEKVIDFFEDMTNCGSTSNPSNFKDFITGVNDTRPLTVNQISTSRIVVTGMDSTFVNTYVPGTAGTTSVSNPFPGYATFYPDPVPADLSKHNQAVSRCDSDQSFNASSSLLDKGSIYFCIQINTTGSPSTDPLYIANVNSSRFPVFFEFTFQLKDLVTSSNINCGTSGSPASFKIAQGFGGILYYAMYWTSGNGNSATTHYFKQRKGMRYLSSTLD